MTFPRTLAGMWSDINKRYHGRSLPAARDMTFRFVADNAKGDHLDGRHERGSTSCTNGRWSIEINEGLQGFPPDTYLALAHESVHVKLGLDKDHRSKEWKAEVRRLTGKGLLGRVF